MILSNTICNWNCQLVIIAVFICWNGVLSTSFCNFNIKVEQNVKNEGFHRVQFKSAEPDAECNVEWRSLLKPAGNYLNEVKIKCTIEVKGNITYGIIFDQENDGERWLYEDCLVGLSQELPSGVFANPDELGDLRRNNKLNALPKNPVNIELPAELSSPNNIYVTGKIIDGRATLWLPVHARYHQAVAGGGIARNEIGPPTLFLHCPDERLEVCGMKKAPVALLCNGSSREKCDWKKMPFTMVTDTLIWDVPVGNTDHYYLVATGTMTVVVVGSLYLLKTIHEYTVSQRKKKL